MTIVAWDGKTLASDRRCEMSGYVVPVTKIFRVSGDLVGVCGALCHAMEILDWLQAGAVPDRVPPFQRTDDYVGVLRITPDRRILKYEKGPMPIRLETPFTAIGSGRDFAIAAMHCGMNSVKAVEISCLYDAGCGNGVDKLEF